MIDAVAGLPAAAPLRGDDLQQVGGPGHGQEQRRPEVGVALAPGGGLQPGDGRLAGGGIEDRVFRADPPLGRAENAGGDEAGDGGVPGAGAESVARGPGPFRRGSL